MSDRRFELRIIRNIQVRDNEIRLITCSSNPSFSFWKFQGSN